MCQKREIASQKVASWRDFQIKEEKLTSLLPESECIMVFLDFLENVIGAAVLLCFGNVALGKKLNSSNDTRTCFAIFLYILPMVEWLCSLSISCLLHDRGHFVSIHCASCKKTS